jgi:N-methylhydantoinase A
MGGAFEDEHERTFGHRLPGQPVRATALRLVATLAARTKVESTSFPAEVQSAESTSRLAYWGPRDGALQTPVLPLEMLSMAVEGPALIDCSDTTIVVPPRATVARGLRGSVVIELGEDT